MHAMDRFEWTDAAMDKAVALWGDGVSATEIAAQLGGGLTRNAVLGKLHRLKSRKGEKAVKVASRQPETRHNPVLRDRVAEQRGKKLAAKPRVAKVQGAGGLTAMRFGTGVASDPKPPQAELLVGPAFAPLPGFAPVRLEDHQNHQCRWPIDIEGERNARCCGAPRDGDHVYCATHRQRGVAAVTPRRPGTVTATELRARKRA